MHQTTLTLNGTRTPTWTDGAGQPLLLLHGSADTPLAWQAVATLLAPEFQVWAPALPPLSGGLAVDHDLPWLDTVMAATGARVLAGHSYGALLALRWALAHPGRLDRLVLAEPIAWGIGRGLPGLDARLDELDRECVARFAQGDIDTPMRWLVDYWNGAGFWQNLPDRVRAHLSAGSARTHAEVASGGADRTHAAELAHLAVATHLLAGDQSTSESQLISKTLAAAIPGATLTVIPGAGHQFLRSHAQVVAQACAGKAA